MIIPAHGGSSNNEKADELAKRGANMQQANLPITIKQKKTIITNMFRVKNIHDDYHIIIRQQPGEDSQTTTSTITTITIHNTHIAMLRRRDSNTRSVISVDIVINNLDSIRIVNS